jgi:TonB-linked SusC/RagA family outer membrane protein
MAGTKRAKLCTLLLLLHTCTILQVKAQEPPRVTISGRRVSLQQIFNTIETQTSYYFSYNAEVDITRTQDVHFKDAPLAQVLNKVLGNGYSWTFDGKSINIRKGGTATTPPPKRPASPADTSKIIIGKQLDETVIIAYGTTTQRFNTGNVTSVKGDAIGAQAGTNLLLALQGRVPGMLITQTGGIGGMAVKVQMRGQNSLLNGTQPLFIVDGIPYNPILTDGLGSQIWGDEASALNFINPQDVESIDVLKDADATAIYGSRGANGVVLITTRKGKPGETQVRVNVGRGFGQTARKVQLMNTPQYLDMRRTAFENDKLTPTESNAPDLLLWDAQRETDWQEELIGGTSNITQVQASVSGGSKHLQCLLSAHYRKEGTVFPGSFGSTLGGLHFSASSTSANQRFRATISSSFLADKTSLPGSDLTAQIMLPPNAPVVHLADGSLNYSWLNPYTALIGPLFDARVKNLLCNVALQYEVLPGLTLKTTLGYHWLTGKSLTITPVAIYPPAVRHLRFGSSRNVRYESASRIMEPQLTFQRQLGGLQLNAVAGGTYQGYNETREVINADGFKDDAMLGNIYFADSVYGRNAGTVYRYLAGFGRIGFNLHNRYLLNVSVRRDGSSRYGPRKRYAVFGAAGAGWIFSEERFMQPLRKVLSFAKLRMSYGTTGNDQIGDYQYLEQYNNVNGSYQGVTGLMPSSLFNADFAWELTKKAEAGLELGFLEDKVLLSASHFIYNSSNQLVPFPVPDISGAGSIIGNLPAKIRNTGWEFVLSAQHIQYEKFEWSSSFNISFVRNKLVSYPDPTVALDLTTAFVQGRPLSQTYVAQNLGVDPNTGAYVFADANHQPVPASQAAESFAVNKAPVYYGGWQNQFRFGQFELELLLQFVKQQGDNTTFDPDIMPGRMRNQYAVMLDSWRRPGDKATYQRYALKNDLREGYSMALRSNLGYADASFIRCRYLEGAWLLPSSWLRRLHLLEGKVYIQAQNLFTMTPYKGLDPETQLRTSLPPLRTLSGGLKITL